LLRAWRFKFALEVSVLFPFYFFSADTSPLFFSGISPRLSYAPSSFFRAFFEPWRVVFLRCSLLVLLALRQQACRLPISRQYAGRYLTVHCHRCCNTHSPHARLWFDCLLPILFFLRFSHAEIQFSLRISDNQSRLAAVRPPPACAWSLTLLLVLFNKCPLSGP